MDRRQIAEEVLAAVGGASNVSANDICMTRLRILTEDPSLVDTEQLSSARGVLGYVKRGSNGFEVVFGPGKVEGVHEALVELTGTEPDEEPFTLDRTEVKGPINVRISPNPLHDAARAQLAGGEKGGNTVDDFGDLEDLEGLDDLDLLDLEPQDADTACDLANLLDELEPEEDEGAGDDRRVLVINGPNLNMLGIREPQIYGHETYQTLLKLCQDAAREAGFADCSCVQSNHEGDLVDAIQDALGKYDGIVINPGAYTHTSVAILDAAKAVALPMVEVHISKVDEREEFRQVSYIRAACFETICGLGLAGYRKAIFDLAEKLGI